MRSRRVYWPRFVFGFDCCGSSNHRVLLSFIPQKSSGLCEHSVFLQCVRIILVVIVGSTKYLADWSLLDHHSSFYQSVLQIPSSLRERSNAIMYFTRSCLGKCHDGVVMFVSSTQNLATDLEHSLDTFLFPTRRVAIWCSRCVPIVNLCLYP